MSIADVLTRLERVRHLTSVSWQACCPAHEDRNPSLSITDTGDRILVHCHAGCDLSDVLAAIGLRWCDLHATACASKLKQPARPPVAKRKVRNPPTFNKARRVWASADPTEPHVVEHAYAKRKGIPIRFGAARAVVDGMVVGQEADCLVIPMHDHIAGEFSGVECINVLGEKQTFGKKGCLKVGDFSNPNPIVHVCEGWATLWAASQIFPNDFLGVACFSASRMQSIAAFYDAELPNRVLAHIEKGKVDLWDVLQDPDASAKLQIDVLGG